MVTVQANRPKPADIWLRLGELAPERNNNVRDQHLVSQALLRRFTDSWPGRQGRVLASMNLDHPGSPPRPAGTGRCGFEPDYLRYASRSAEALWKVTEDRLPEAAQAAMDGSLFQHPDLVQVIRDTMALHFVRSHQTPIVHRDAWLTTRDEARAQWLRNEAMLDWAFFKRYGLHPAAGGRGAREAIVDELMRPMEELVGTGALLRIRIEHLFTEAKRIVNGAGLEIVSPAAGEFLIGDTPALALRFDRPHIGPIGGVAIGNAHQIVLPLGPRILASLGPTDSYGLVPAAMVEGLNEAQVRAARAHVYFRPGSGLEQSVRVALRRHPRPPTGT
jgi:hypothetical protein